jgi:hypothetical protein
LQNANSEVVDIKLDLRRYVGNFENDPSDVANQIHGHLEKGFVKDPSRMKKTHVFLFDEVQKLL